MWPLRPINSSKYRPKEEFSGNGAAGQKRGRAQRKLTAKSKKPRSSAQRGERRETRSDGGRLREEKKNNKKENASCNSSRQAGGRNGRKEERRRCDRSVRVQVMQERRDASSSPSHSLFLSPSLLPPFLPSSRSYIRHYIHLSFSLSISLSFFFSLPLSLSLSCCGDSVLQVVRPPIGGCTRRCAWVGEAWYPSPIGYRILPTPEVGTRRRKEDRNEGGQKLKAAPPLGLGRERAKTISHLARNVAKTCQVAFRLTLRVTAFCTQHTRASMCIYVRTCL